MTEPVITIDLDSPVPVYRQIADALRALIVEGALPPGERLPTVRQLAIDLAVHHNTVAEAYRQLAEEGWLSLGRRRGATVTGRQTPTPTELTREQFARHLRELAAKGRANGLSTEEISGLMNEWILKERKAQA